MPSLTASRESLLRDFHRVRRDTEDICSFLLPDDYPIQSIIETSPPKWHIAHVTWFFEEFVLGHFLADFKPFHPRFAYLFNSYYETVGSMQPRPKRGLLARPALDEVYRYRAWVDERMADLFAAIGKDRWDDFSTRVTLGLNHEQQHQELLLMDIKHNFSVNPLRPAYRDDLKVEHVSAPPLTWLERSGGIREIGHDGNGFAFDNESPRNKVLVGDHRLASRTITNGEYLAFIDDDGYHRPELWLADGWYWVHRERNYQPLYWERIETEWWLFTLGGLRKLPPDEPICHLSFYEADAYARWAGKRLPSEAELELMLVEQQPQGNFNNRGFLHPVAGDGHWFGNLWEWTTTPYGPYPGFKPLAGSMGEYNGKFMCNQMVLKGGSCLTPAGHTRASYRNFFYPHDRWPACGLRLAEDLP